MVLEYKMSATSFLAEKLRFVVVIDHQQSQAAWEKVN